MLRFALLAVVASSVIASLPAQVPCFNTTFGANLALADDGVAVGLPLGFPFTYNGVVYTDICVSANGYIWLGPTTTETLSDFTPTEGELLGGAPRICPLWCDFNATAVGSGQIYFDNGVPGQATVTWDNVIEYGRTHTVQFQVVLDASSNVHITYGGDAPLGGTLSTNVIVGASPGGGAASNPVSFATRPLNIAANNFAQVQALPPAWALTSVSMLWTPLSPGYLVTDAPCTPLAGFSVVGAGCPVAPSGLGAGDDTTHALALPFAFPHAAAGPFSNIVVSSNGFLTLGTANPGDGCCAGSVPGLLSGPPRVSPFWQDLVAAGSSTSAYANGDVFAGLDTAGNYVVTWSNVGEYGDATPAANSFQVALAPTGDISIRYGNVGITHATRVALCGYSRGAGAVDPGPTDLSGIGAPSIDTIYELFDNTTPNPIDLSGLNFLLTPNGGGGYFVIPGAGGAFVPPAQALTLAAAPGSVPKLNQTFTMDVTGVAPAPNGNICILLLSSEIPPVNLGFLGMTGCTAYLALPEFLSFLNFSLGANTSFGVGIPNDMSLAGQQIMSQVASDDVLANPFGWRASNGGRWYIGL